VQSRFVIDRDFFAGFYVAQRKKENVIVEDLHESVWATGMVDVVSAVSTAASVKTPTTVDLADSEHLSMRSTTCLSVRDFFASILGDLASLFERYGCEAALTVYQRRSDS
jgi:hypothetical protein